MDLPPGHRPAGRAPADGVDPDLLALQSRRDLRYGLQPHSLPHRLRIALRDLPLTELLHRDPEGHPRVGSDRRRLRAADLRSPDSSAWFAGDRVARDLPVPLDVERPDRCADVRTQYTADHRGDLLAAHGV